MKKILSHFMAIAFISAILFSVSCKNESEFSVKINKEKYTYGDEIIIEFKANPEWADDAWIGIIPSNIEHGKESINDENDIKYEYLNKKASGTIKFSVPPDAGKYDIRMNDSDDNGNEIHSVTFEMVVE